jgi:TolB-like protein/Tfp pilus assembly protein PilF
MPGGIASFWGQLKRRNVFKVGASYAIVAWIALQAAGILLPTFGAPEWVMRVFAALLILGFPVVLALAWIFEVTPEGIRRTSDVPEEQSVHGVTSRRLNYVLASLLGIALLFIAIDELLLDAAVAPAAGSSATTSTRNTETSRLPNSVAVLPLENLSTNPDHEYVADGLHEEILNQLAKLSNVNVIARSSVLQFRENRPPIPEIARALNVQAIMEGSVRYSGERIRVTTQLIDAATDTHLWSETYDREFDDIFAIESDVAMRVANALQAEFSEDEQRAISREPTVSSEAYALYLRSRRSSNALALLDEAIRIDPRFALAYAYKARLYAEAIVNTTGNSAQEDWTALVGLATSNAERALAIDSGTGLAHLALGTVHQRTWRWEQAKQAFQRALELTPNDTQIIRDYAWHAAFSGDYAEGVRFARRQVELSPAVSGALLDLAITLEYAGDVDAALKAHQSALAISPRLGISRVHAALLAARKGDIAGALTDFELLENQLGGNVPVVFLPELAVGYAAIGRGDDARRLADQIFALVRQRDLGAGTLAMAYLAIGDADGAAAQLEIAAARVEKGEPDQGFFSLMHIKNNWFGHPLLEEPRFEALRERLEPAR